MTSNPLSTNYFAVVYDGLEKSIPRQAQRVLELQHHDEKHVVPPTTVRFDAIRPTKSLCPPAILINRFVDYPFDRILTGGLILVKGDRGPHVLGSKIDFWTRSLDLVEMVETLLQFGEDGVENRGRGSTRPTQVDGRLVDTK